MAIAWEKDSTKHAHETEARVRDTNHNDDNYKANKASGGAPPLWIFERIRHVNFLDDELVHGHDLPNILASL